MTPQEFISKIAPLVQKYAPQYNIKVCSPIIAQAVLESASGTSELAVNAHNYFGLKYRKGRCPSACGIYYKVGSEQNADGSYSSSAMQWQKFATLEDGIRGYFDFINIPNYASVKGVTDPKTYLVNIKNAGYATSIRYVENLLSVIAKYNLTKYDTVAKNDNISNNTSPYTFKTNIANKSNYGNSRATSAIKYIVIHYTANDGDSDENNGKYFHNNIVKASAHYFVDSDSVTQSVPDNYVAYSVGGNKYSNCSVTGGGSLYGKCTNANSISIELCDDYKNGILKATQGTIDNAIVLTKSLMTKYDIPLENVIRHFDVNGKGCPAYWCGDATKNALWLTEFKNKLGKYSTTTPTKPTLPSTPTSSATTYTVVKGDTLSKIGTKTGVAWKTIADINGIKLPYTIKVGQVLKLTNDTSTTSKGKYIHNGLDYSLIFDPVYYANKYSDLKVAFGSNKTKLFEHFVKFGMREGRMGNAKFNVTAYKNRYADLRKAFGNNLPEYYRHYIEFGFKEERNAL